MQNKTNTDNNDINIKINTDKNENMSQKHFSNQEQVILNICMKYLWNVEH